MITYQRLIEKLIYLSYGIHPDIAFVVGQLSCHNSDPRVGYLRIAKQVLCYLKGTITLDIEWGNNFAGYQLGGRYGELRIVKYANSNYAGNLEDKKSIIGYYFFLGGAIVTWCSKRQYTVSTSTLEAEYIAVSQGVRERIWI